MQNEIHIDGLGHGGEGLGRIDGEVCFIPGALPGDTVRVGEIQRRKGVARARVEEIVSPSPHRQAVECPVFGECGGCNWLHFAYPAQREWKQKIVRDCLRRIGGIEVEVGYVEEPSLQFGYRTRATFHGDGTNWGFYKAGSHKVVDLENCPLCHPHLKRAYARLRTLRFSGSVELTVNPEGDDVLVWSDTPHAELRECFPEAQSGGDGGKRTSFSFDGVPVINGAFSQSSLLLNRNLRETVHGMLGGVESLLDLYCGAGNFSRAYCESSEVVGIDNDGVSVMAADRNGPGEYRVGDEKAMKLAIEERVWDAILLDPPRTGGRKLSRALAKAQAGRIVYVSCDPATLARDARALIDGGWKLDRAVMVDMFPHTAHIETVCLFIRPS